MEGESNLALWVVIWVIVIGIIVANRWRRGAVGAGLPFAFLLNLWLLHWPAAVIYILPWYLDYDINDNLGLVEAGFEQSTYAVIAFGLGIVIFAPILLRLFQFPGPVTITRVPDRRVAKMYIMIGSLFFFARFSPISTIPTFAGLLAAGFGLLAVGLGLACWTAWQESHRTAFLGWLLTGLSLPLFTIVIMGFLSFGTWLFFSIFAFIASFFRPRWKLIVLALLLGYFGLSFYGSYLRDRDAIRAVVWGEEAPLIDRIETLYQTVTSPEWFDPFNPLHLLWIDSRLNLNLQAGTAVNYLASGNAEFAAGSTLWWSVIGMIPRVLWPNKPSVAGGSEFVSSYTGIEFWGETSVAPGLVMEFYVNFGTLGVVLGFLCLGVIIGVVDFVAGQRLSKGDWYGFVLWFLPGLALVAAETSLAIVTTSAGSAVVVALLVNSYLLSRGKYDLPARGKVRSSLHSIQDGASHPNF